MPVRSLSTHGIFSWIPPSSTCKFGVTVERDDGTVDDVTSRIMNLEVNDGVTDGIGSFTFEIADPAQTYKDAWDGMEIFRYYKDYAASATSLRFRGRIESVSYRTGIIRCKGRTDSFRLMEKTVTQSYADTECSVILKDLIDKYGESIFTYSNVNASSVSLTVTWYQKPFWDCIKELCTATGFDAYVDHDLDMHFFESGSVANDGEAVVHGYNLMEVEDFAEDITQVRNRVIVYGSENDGIQVIYTANDTGSQSSYGIREEILNDDNITTFAQAKDVADYELSLNKDPPVVGSVTAAGVLATIQPGETMNVSAPLNNMAPAKYLSIGYTDKISTTDNRFQTKVSLQQDPRRTADVLKSLIEGANQKKRTSANPFEMRYSYNFLFDNDEGVHTGTEITQGVLRGVGYWISPMRTLDANITQAYLVLVGETLTGAVVEVSGNNGVDWQEIGNKERIDITSATGKNLIIRVTISDADTQIDSLSMQYKTG